MGVIRHNNTGSKLEFVRHDYLVAFRRAKQCRTAPAAPQQSPGRAAIAALMLFAGEVCVMHAAGVDELGMLRRKQLTFGLSVV